MRILPALVGLGSATVYLPTHDWDIKHWRLLPLMPYVFLENSCKYVIFLADDGNYVMTVKCRFDDNQGEAVEAQNIDNVARGFFIRDASYGFESLDGFVVWFVAES